MKDTPESTKIKMLADAGYIPNELQEKYLKLVDFISGLAGHQFSWDEVEYIEEKAKDLLKEIGETV